MPLCFVVALDALLRRLAEEYLEEMALNKLNRRYGASMRLNRDDAANKQPQW